MLDCAAYVGCDNKDHNGLMLADTSVCPLPETNYALQYYTTETTIWFNISLIEGSAFVINSTACSSALDTVLNGCAPFSASSELDLDKYGGSITVNNGTGGAARFAIDLKKTAS